MASPNTVKAKRTQEELAKTHPSLPRTSSKWIGRTKGLPFSRTMLKGVEPGMHGVPATLKMTHPTRGRVHQKHATPELLRVFFPSLPENLAAAMLGI